MTDPCRSQGSPTTARFRERIKRARLALRMSQKEAAHLAGLKHQCLWSRLETGAMQPSLDVAERMARAVRVELLASDFQKEEP